MIRRIGAGKGQDLKVLIGNGGAMRAKDIRLADMRDENIDIGRGQEVVRGGGITMMLSLTAMKGIITDIAQDLEAVNERSDMTTVYLYMKAIIIITGTGRDQKVPPGSL